jgi:hypothetical protein
MLRRITAEQFWGWMNYHALEPFGEKRQDYRIASVVQALYNINRDTKKHPEPFEIEGFLVKFGELEEPSTKPFRTQTLAQQKAAAMAIIAAFAPRKVA